MLKYILIEGGTMHKVIAFKYLFIVASMYIFVFQNYLQTQINSFKNELEELEVKFEKYNFNLNDYS